MYLAIAHQCPGGSLDPHVIPLHCGEDIVLAVRAALEAAKSGVIRLGGVISVHYMQEGRNYSEAERPETILDCYQNFKDGRPVEGFSAEWRDKGARHACTNRGIPGIE